MHLVAGGIWKGDIFVADIEELGNLDALEIHARRLNAKEVLTSKRCGIFTFPIADGAAKLSGRDREVRDSTQRQDQTWNESTSQRRTSRKLREVSTNRNTRWRWSPQWLLVNQRWLHISSSQWTSTWMTRTSGGFFPLNDAEKISMAPSARKTREKWSYSAVTTSGHNRCHRALRPFRLWWGARRPDLFQPAGAIEAHYEHSGYMPQWLSRSFVLRLPVRDTVTPTWFRFELGSSCRKKNHSQFRWSLLTWSGRTQIWMYCRKNVSMIIGTMWIEFRFMDRMHEVHVEWETSRIFVVREAPCRLACRKQLRRRRSKNGVWRNQRSTTLENRKAFFNDLEGGEFQETAKNARKNGSSYGSGDAL